MPPYNVLIAPRPRVQPYVFSTGCPRDHHRHTVTSPLSILIPQKNPSKPAFEVDLDVRGFQHDDIKVHAKDNTVRVECKHAARRDALGTVERQYVRTYDIPEFQNIDMSTIRSSLSPKGILNVAGYRAAPEVRTHERVIPIHIQPHLEGNTDVSKENVSEEKTDNNVEPKETPKSVDQPMEDVTSTTDHSLSNNSRSARVVKKTYVEEGEGVEEIEVETKQD